MRKLLLAGFSAVALMFSATPSLAALIIVGGTAHVTPPDGGDGITGNQVIPNTAGFLSASLSATAGTYEYTFIGFEAEFDDFFHTTSGSFHNQTTPVGGTLVVVHAGGLLEFSFTVLDAGGSVIGAVLNGGNDGTLPNFFLGDAGGGGVYIAMDDSGAGPDDNHDDLVVLVREVGIPEPASLALFGAALAGLALIRRRKV